MKNYTNREKLNAFQKRYDPITTAYRDPNADIEKTLQKWKERTTLKLLLHMYKRKSLLFIVIIYVI